jgi:predicted N-acyltransferase
VEVVHRIADVRPERWDDLAAGRPFLDHRWLRLTEAVLAGHEPRYVLLSEGERLAAAAVCALDRRFQRPRLQRLAGGLLRHFPALRCGVPVALQPGLLIRPGAAAPARRAALLAALDRLAAAERAAFVKLEHLPSAGEHLPPAGDAWPGLSRAGYRPLDAWATTAIDLTWPTFDAYLAALPPRKRRDVVKIRRRAAAEGIEVAPLEPAPPQAGRLDELMGNVLRRHDALDAEAYHPARLARAGAVLGPDLRLLAVRRHGRLVGCASLLSSAKWLGLDYAQTWGTAAYLSLLLEVIAQAIARGATRLHTGATAYDTKRHLGAAVEWRAGAVRFRGALLNRLAGAALAASRAHPARPARPPGARLRGRRPRG